LKLGLSGKIKSLIVNDMGYVGTHNSRTDIRILKLGGGVDHVIRHVLPLTKVKRSKVNVTRPRNVSTAIAL